MFVILVEFVANEGHEQALHNRLMEQAADSLANEENCHQFDVCADPEDPSHFVLYEVYSSQDDFQYHITTEHYARFAEDTKPMVKAKSPIPLTRTYPAT